MNINKSIIILLIFISMVSCKSDDNSTNTAQIRFEFTQNWDGIAVTNADFNISTYTNAHGEEVKIDKLRYLISNIVLHNSNGETIEIDGYQLVDVTNGTNLSFTPTIAIPQGEYTNISFIFGFDEEDNTDGTYLDLNSALWNVPNTPMLGSIGGYHYMQFEGKFIDNTMIETPFQYHAIRAANGMVTPPIITETYIENNIGAVSINGNTSIEIKMNIAEWFKNPNTWDLNTIHSMMMPNYNAQIMINQNGQNVFSLGNVLTF